MSETNVLSEAMLMILPDLFASMCAPKIWHARSVPVRFTSTIFCHSLSGNDTVGARLIMPAQLTRMSTCLNRSSQAASSACKDCASSTSLGCRSVWRPAASISAAVLSTCSGRRAEATTSAPAWARPRLIARPMPEVPPMTTAVFPVRSKSEDVVAKVLSRNLVA